ncbi:MAG: 16S rRNA processing protein RimM [Chloroflexi bacterium]|jgi:16S rRNA processing protein RimM|nr:16S rRNA processing protein RimM [Chloroflexota bacterium]MBT7082390.1 16S rRNA processing protein RimM [Chloroflexota bacterium]MBT7290630.1 16S rRNA processing protein RimM [Chloroflexota bacterium]
MEDDFLIVGRVLAPWGLRGDLKSEVITDFPQRFAPNSKVYIDGIAMTIERSRFQKGNVILKLAGIDSIEQVEPLRNKYLKVPQSEAIPLENDQYYHHQLIGLEVITSRGKQIGSIADILPTGSNDVYVVKGNGKEYLIPAINDVVVQIDLDKGIMIIEEIKDLL